MEFKFKGRGDNHRFDYSKITDQIYIGSDFCKRSKCKLHKNQFKKLGICVEPNLSSKKKEISPSGIDVYTWLPLIDGYPPMYIDFYSGED